MGWPLLLPAVLVVAGVDAVTAWGALRPATSPGAPTSVGTMERPRAHRLDAGRHWCSSSPGPLLPWNLYMAYPFTAGRVVANLGPTSYRVPPGGPGWVADLAARIAEGFEPLDFDQRQRLVRLVIEEVRVTGRRVELRLRAPLDDGSPEGGGDPPIKPSSPSPGPKNLSRARRRGHVSSHGGLRPTHLETSEHEASS